VRNPSRNFKQTSSASSFRTCGSARLEYARSRRDVVTFRRQRSPQRCYEKILQLGFSLAPRTKSEVKLAHENRNIVCSHCVGIRPRGVASPPPSQPRNYINASLRLYVHFSQKKEKGKERKKRVRPARKRAMLLKATGLRGGCSLKVPSLGAI